MNGRLNNSDHRNPLPESFSPVLCEIDARVREVAAQSPAPAGLSDRIFDASVSMLAVEAAPARQTLRLAGTESRRLLWSSGWSRMAMAASLLLALGISVWFVQRSTSPAGVVDLPEAEFALASALQRLPGSSEQIESDVNYLFKANDVTSVDSITNEIALLERELEM